MNKRFGLLVSTVSGLVLFAYLCSEPTWVLANRLYPHLGPGDSSSIPGLGRPIAVWAVSSTFHYGDPKSMILWDGVLRSALFSGGLTLVWHLLIWPLFTVPWRRESPKTWASALVLAGCFAWLLLMGAYDAWYASIWFYQPFLLLTLGLAIVGRPTLVAAISGTLGMVGMLLTLLID